MAGLNTKPVVCIPSKRIGHEGFTRFLIRAGSFLDTTIKGSLAMKFRIPISLG
jgi:hypothetical protein